MRKKILLLLPLLVAVSALASAAASGAVGERIAAQGLVLTVLSIFLGGVAVSLTPCLYPMIPITLSIIGARSAGQKPILGFLRSLVFVLGIALVYSLLGFFVARSGRTFGFILQNPYFLGAIAAFFVVMGVSMLGMFEIQMPAAIAGRLQQGANRGGYLGAFLLGLVTGVVASPCGSPVLVSVLAYAARSGQGAVGFLLLFAYALGIGMLFLLLGTFPSFLKAMPKSGVWMEDVKRFLGVVLIGVGIYYLNLVIPAAVYWPLVAVLCLAGAVVIVVKSAERAGFPRLLAAWRLAGAVLVTFAVYVAVAQVPASFGVAGGTEPAAAVGADRPGTPAEPASKPAATATTATAETKRGGELAWLTDEKAGIEEVKRTGKPMIVDFTAAWCAACKQLDRKTFSDPKVRAQLEGFVRVKIDCTKETPENAALQKKYGSPSLPTVAFVTKDGEIRSELTLYEFEAADKFLERLGKVPR